MLYCQASHTRVRFESLIGKLDKQGNVKEIAPESICQGDTALVEMKINKQICIEAFSDYAPFGRIVISDRSNVSEDTGYAGTLIIGQVKKVYK